MYTASLLLTGVALVAALPQDAQLLNGNNDKGGGFICPEDGVYEDEYQCDKYWVCDRGHASPKLCEDGLVFDIFKANAGSADPCESPYVVDCGNRLDLQEPSFTSEYCPRKNGIFADPDPTVCNRFYTCINAHPTATDCAHGLHFDETNGNCAWPKSSGRTGCSSKKKECIGDFCCDGKERLTHAGVVEPHPTFPNLDDCQKFFVCLNGEKPQESSCALGEVYNERTKLCDWPENVPECDGWYINHPEFAHYYDTDSAFGNSAASDVGAQDTPAG